MIGICCTTASALIWGYNVVHTSLFSTSLICTIEPPHAHLKELDTKLCALQGKRRSRLSWNKPTHRTFSLETFLSFPFRGGAKGMLSFGHILQIFGLRPPHDLGLPERVEQGAQWAQPALSSCLEAFIIYSLSLSNNFIAGVRKIFDKFTGLRKATFQAIESAVPSSFSPNKCLLGLFGLLANACHFVTLQSKHNARMHALQKNGPIFSHHASFNMATACYSSQCIGTEVRQKYSVRKNGKQM